MYSKYISVSVLTTLGEQPFIVKCVVLNVVKCVILRTSPHIHNIIKVTKTKL